MKPMINSFAGKQWQVRAAGITLALLVSGIPTGLAFAQVVPPSLTLVKVVVNDVGGLSNVGTASPSAWTLSATNTEDPRIVISGLGSVSSDDTFPAGTYSLSETGGPEGYTSGNWNCVVNGVSVEMSINSIDIGSNDVAICTITNTAQPAHLTIAKYTDNGSGDDSFNFRITGTDTEFSRSLSDLETVDGAATSSVIDLPAGSFNVSETSIPAGWHFSGASCTYDGNSVGQPTEGGEAITVGNGDSVTCTFHDTRKAILTVRKIVINDNGGNAAASDFGFKINGGGATAFESDGQNDIAVDPGTYSVTETSADGYTSSLDGCSDVELEAGSTAICTITNDDILPPPPPVPPPATNGGSNGPIVGTFGLVGGQVLGASTATVGQVLGASTTTAPSCDTAALLAKYMRRGQPNDTSEVKKLQQFLNGEMGSGLPTTGIFGMLTENAVKAFQTKYLADVLNPWEITGPTGYVYKTTLWKINMIICASLNTPKPQVP